MNIAFRCLKMRYIREKVCGFYLVKAAGLCIRFYLFLFFPLSSVLLSAAPQVSRNYAYRHFTTRDGLAQMQVVCAFQDADGYIWFGTKDGVSRYDGVSFSNYTTDQGLPYGIPREISQWDDKIVFLYNTAFALLYPDDHIKVIYLPKELYFEKTDVSKSLTLAINEDEFLIGSIGKPVSENFNPGVYKYSLSKNTLTPYKGEMLRKHQLMSLRNDTLLGPGRIYKLDHQTMTVKKLMDLPSSDFYLTDRSFTEFYFKDSVSIKRYLREGDKLIFSNIVSVLQAKPTSDACFYLNNNTLIYLDDNQIRTYPDRKMTFSVTFPFIQSFFADKENNLWICTENGLYNFFNLNIEEWRLGLSDNDAIWSIVEDNQGNMWFGSFGNGLWKMDSSEKLIPVKTDEKYWKFQYFNSIKSASGELYFPYPAGIARYSQNRFDFAPQLDTSLAMYYDNATNTLYSGASNGIRRGLKVGFGDTGKVYGWDKNYVTCIAKDAKGRIRLGSFRGQGVFTGDTILEDTVRRSYRGVISMSADSSGRLWKGTETGLFVELPDGSERQVAPGKIKRRIFSLHVYRDKYLLLGGSTSLYLVNLNHMPEIESPEVWEITYDRGFTGLESGQNGFFEDSKGDVWLTSALCMLKFNPQRLVESQTKIIPSIRVSKLYYSKDNATWEQKTCDKKGPKIIKLKANNKFLKFEFVSNSISAPNLLRFKYRLKGFSDEWSNPTYTKNAEFTNLNYGKYQFEVQCSLDGIHWSPVASTAQIQIVSPFWGRWYMLLLYSLEVLIFIAGAVFVFIRRKHYKKMEQLNRQKLENELQIRTLHSKVLPHFTKNVLTAIASFAMDDNRKAGKYISLFARFSELTLANSDKNYNTLEEEMKYIRTYLELEEMRFRNKLQYEITIENDVDMQTFVPAMALHTYCDNAIRHGLVNKKGPGKLNITIKKNGGGTVIIVRDNGIGRKRSAELGTHGNKLGLKLIQQQVEFYNTQNEWKIKQEITDLHDHEGRAAGTLVELYIPDGYVFSSN